MGGIESSQYRAKLELHLIRKLELDQVFFFLDIQNSAQKIVDLLEFNSIKLESILKLLNNYT